MEHSFLYKLIKRLSKKTKAQDADAESLRIAFKFRYHKFKLLLYANNDALEVMSDLEQALKGLEPFGMDFIRSRCTQISTAVFQIVKNMNELASGKYTKLYSVFKKIQQHIDAYANHKTGIPAGPLCISLKNIDGDMIDLVGPKMAHLAEIDRHLRLNTPEGFVITAHAFQRFMDDNNLQVEINRVIRSADINRQDHLFSLSTKLQQMIIQSTIPQDLAHEIMTHYKRMDEKGESPNVSLRSSALGEDLPGASSAGQYQSVLNVNKENILHVYKEVIASKYNISAMTYRLNRGIRDEDVYMCVGCMKMIHAASSGGVYTKNPVDPQTDNLILNSVWGLPKSVVDGSTQTDMFVLSRSDPMEIIQRHIPKKMQQFVCFPEEGVSLTETIEGKRNLPSITDDQVFLLAATALKIESFYGQPQDIEWAIEQDGTVFMLQCRSLHRIEKPHIEPSRPLEQAKDHPVLLKGGVNVSPGNASGPVYKVQKDVDALLFPKNAVLVTRQALPRWAALLSRASAVITGQGSIVGHLATVAREFNVPAIFGMEDALDTLANQQTITVDADSAVIYDGEVRELLHDGKPLENIMKGSPVFESLTGVVKHIVPLNLLDPDSPQFKAENCRTFHDITRFCHEKSVQEMFRFGRDHQFPERSSKQLRVRIPLKWWVLNLDDGFKEEVKGKYVQLENIISIPMLAIWEGITAIPWEGPPPVDGKGFVSVMFQATTNRNLLTAVPSNYTNRNYFMISKNFCSLQSRLGAHFATVEALISERTVENYIAFQFKGGAADFDRQLRRLHFVQEILERYGFHVLIRKNALRARLEGNETEFMKGRLKIIGYLSIHTRQLDMIMENASSVQYYQSKIQKDIKAILSGNSKNQE